VALAEDVVNDVKLTLETNLEAILTPLELTSVAEYLLGEKTLDEIAFTPAVYIFADETVVEGWRSNPNGQWDATHSLSIGIVIEDLDSGVLRVNLYKYMTAIMGVIVDAYAPGDFWPRGPFRIRYSPLLARESEYLGDAVLTMRFQRVEDR
jgi:hypothetical protein